MDLLRVWLTYNKPHVITLSETWFNSNISDEVKYDNQSMFYLGTIGAQEASYVSSNLTAEPVLPNENPHKNIFS